MGSGTGLARAALIMALLKAWNGVQGCMQKVTTGTGSRPETYTCTQAPENDCLAVENMCAMCPSLPGDMMIWTTWAVLSITAPAISSH